MSRHPQRADGKGSLRDLQLLINERPGLLSDKVAAAFGDGSFRSIRWTSPLGNDSYSEYRDADFLDCVGISPSIVPLSKFWPNRGPQWDALGVTKGGKPVLVEAKANLAELVSPRTGASAESLELIKRSLEDTKKYLGVKGGRDWTDLFYQYTNRLAHLYFLRTLNKIPAFLIFVYFVDDQEVKGPRTAGEWTAAITVMKAVLGIGTTKLDSFIADIFVETKLIRKGGK